MHKKHTTTNQIPCEKGDLGLSHGRVVPNGF
jgi:hypothetical protein